MHYYWQEQAPHHNLILCYFDSMRWHASLPLLIRREFYEHGASTGLHRHEDFYALYLVLGGCGLHVINDHPYAIVRGDVYILPPGTVHAYHDYHALELDACYFQPQVFSDAELVALRGLSGFWNLLVPSQNAPTRTEEQSAPPMPAVDAFTDHRLHLSPEHYHDIEAMIAEMSREFMTNSPEAALLTRGLFFRALIYLARWQAAQTGDIRKLSLDGNPTTTRPQRTAPYEMADVLRLCEERYAETLTVPQLAALMFLSPGHFTELFSREVGMPPAAYIRRLRLERSQTLLRTTTLSITRIAHQVGFSDGAQFSRAFQAFFHMTPTSYRATFKKSGYQPSPLSTQAQDGGDAKEQNHSS